MDDTTRINVPTYTVGNFFLRNESRGGGTAIYIKQGLSTQ